jgi:Phage tail protein (Tail_P2_I)
MENFFNIDVYDLKTLKNAFISVGLDYFDDMPINYQRRLLKMVNTLLSHKGTNQAINEIVELFGFSNVDIYRYILAKGYNTDPKTGRINYKDPYLMFFKTPSDKEIDFKKDLMLSYESITSNDPYWQSSEEEVKTLSFNFVNSKYMSVDTTIDAMNETIGLAYFMSLLNKFQEEYKQREGMDFGFINKKISKNVINVHDAIVDN